MFFQKNTTGVSWLLVCLGNPGRQYDNTRHNIGFMVADFLAKEQGQSIEKVKFKALTNQFVFGEEKVLVMKPTTFMNLSGEAVRQAADYYKIPPERILVVSDEVAFPVGKLKVSAKGSAGGHNGLKNIIALLGTDQFPRIRVGVGEKPHPDMDMADWVLGKFPKEDNVDDAVKLAAQAVELVFTQDVATAMSRCNGASKGSGVTRKASPKGKRASVEEVSDRTNVDKEHPLPSQEQRQDSESVYVEVLLDEDTAHGG